MKRPHLLSDLFVALVMGALAISLDLSPWPVLAGMFAGAVLYRLDYIIEVKSRGRGQ